MIYYTPDDFKIDCETLAQKIKKARLACKVIYGIPQGGTALAMELSRLLGKRVIDTKELAEWDKECVLVVDDVVDSGATISRFKDYQTATLHVKPNTPKEFFPNFHCNLIDDWITYWWESSEEQSLKGNITRILQFIGEDVHRPGLVETPDRVARAYKEMFRGYGPFDFKLKDFPSTYSGLVFRGPVPFYSFCEHHMLPYAGRAYFGYIPDGKVVGASKMIRFIQHCGARLTIQEELTDQIVDIFMKEVQPQGCGLVMSASHLCEACRGVKVPDVPFGTHSLRGIFQEPSVKDEFLWRVGAKL